MEQGTHQAKQITEGKGWASACEKTMAAVAVKTMQTRAEKMQQQQGRERVRGGQGGTLRPADRAGGKLSLSARVKALSMTRLQVASDRWGAKLPSRMVVLALMGGSSSTCTTPLITQQPTQISTNAISVQFKGTLQRNNTRKSYPANICTL